MSVDQVTLRLREQAFDDDTYRRIKGDTRFQQMSPTDKARVIQACGGGKKVRVTVRQEFFTGIGGHSIPDRVVLAMHAKGIPARTETAGGWFSKAHLIVLEHVTVDQAVEFANFIRDEVRYW